MQGVFINPAFIEPFGLTLIEVLFLLSIKRILYYFCIFLVFPLKVPIKCCVHLNKQAAAHGLPMVATKNGGPVDIHRV